MRFSKCFRVIVSPNLAYFIICLYLNCEGFEVWEFSVSSAVLHLSNNSFLTGNSLLPRYVVQFCSRNEPELPIRSICTHSISLRRRAELTLLIYFNQVPLQGVHPQFTINARNYRRYVRSITLPSFISAQNRVNVLPRGLYRGNHYVHTVLDWASHWWFCGSQAQHSWEEIITHIVGKVTGSCRQPAGVVYRRESEVRTSCSIRRYKEEDFMLLYQQ